MPQAFFESRGFLTRSMYGALIVLGASLLGSGCSSSSDGDDSGGGGEGGQTNGGAAGSSGSGGTSLGGDSNLGGSDTGGTGGMNAGSGGEGGATGGTSGNGGSAGTGGDPNEDPPAPRDLAVNTATACNCTVSFSAAGLDEEAGMSPTPTHANDEEKGSVDTTKPMKGKLVMTFGGLGAGPGSAGLNAYAEALGFHTLQIAMQTNISSAPDDPYANTPEAERTDEDNRQMGDGRMEAWDGVDRVDWLDINPADAVVRRTERALAYMQQQDPGGDWAYFLNEDGSVRWTDVWLVGYSYGAQTLAVVTKYVRVGRGIAASGPQDERFPNATWIHQESATPLDRLYMMVADVDAANKVATVQNAGWLGEPLTVQEGVGPEAFADEPHLFVLEGGDHGEFCVEVDGPWKNLCEYVFGVSSP